MATRETLKKLTDYQHARLRTEMYLGSREPHTQEVLHFNGRHLMLHTFTWVPALYTALRELIDNSLDEMVGHKHGDTLTVTYEEDGMVFSVADNGRGLPIAERTQLGKGPAASILLGEARAGRNFDVRGQVAGTNGLGAACTNFTAEWFELDVYHGAKRLKQRWEESTYRGMDKHKTKGPNVIRGSTKKHGTTITYTPSAKVFPHMLLPTDFVRGRLWDIAVANPKIKIIFNGNRLMPKRGRDVVEATYFLDTPVGVTTFKDDTFTSRFYIVPGFNGDDEAVHSVVNNLPALQGGTHIEAFRNLFYPTAMTALTSPRGNVFNKEKLTLTRADLSNGMLIFNVTTMNGPNFDSQTKSRLITEVRSTMRGCFDAFEIGSMFRHNPKWVEMIAERCRRRTSDKDNKDVAREQRKLSKTKIAKLSDAIGEDRTKCVLFLGEGDSALNLMMNVRDPEIHGCLPLRGKILNVHGVTAKKVIDNKALLDIMTSIGLQIGVKANSSNLRYGSVYIATDEDEDGKNIMALLINFLYRFWPELFKTKFIFKFSTPFIIAHKGKQTKYIYADDYPKFQANLGKWKGWSITRAKGLGALEEEDWEHALTKPELVPIVDDGDLKESLDLIFNPTRADDRKEWLSHE
jgi:DNA gyrase/topoisomerase IV subunit B